MPFPVPTVVPIVGEMSSGLPFGWTIEALQKWVLIYLGLSSLAFVLVWVVGFLRRP
jgi:hypothetical protein